MSNTYAAGVSYDYADNGDNWITADYGLKDDGSPVNECDGGVDGLGARQSPIDIIPSEGAQFSSEDDAVTKKYLDYRIDPDMPTGTEDDGSGNEVPVSGNLWLWGNEVPVAVGKTLTYDLQALDGNYFEFTSKLSRDYYGGPSRWTARQFHMHTGSENTINGKQYDIEMHVVHTPHAD